MSAPTPKILAGHRSPFGTSEADIDQLTNSPEWKSEFAKLKYENVHMQVFQFAQ
jgi:hypothetical protein